ncbi:MAG: helix-turn-helix domain-containing protein [Roseburia hominis]
MSNYESGERTPSVENLMALANLYHCSTDYLLGFQTNENDNTLDVSMLCGEQKHYYKNC